MSINITERFDKSSILFNNGESPKDYFYIITKGRAVSYNSFYENYKISLKEGSIIGLISAIIKEPYYVTTEALDDIEVLKINVNNIVHITNKELVNRVSNYLSYILETWLSKYYSLVIKNKVDLYNKEDILIMASIYKNNKFIDASYKICIQYIELCKDECNTEKVEQFLKYLKPKKKPQLITENTYKIKKGYCLYTEISSSNYVYIIKSGRVGIYNIINQKQTVRLIYPEGYIINGYPPSLEYKPLLTTAIAIEDSVIEILKKEELINAANKNEELRVALILVTAVKVNNVTLKIKAVKEKELKNKLIIILYSIIKIETLFKKEKIIKLPYKIKDIIDMIDLDNDIKEICSEFENIKYVELDTFNNIIVNNTEYFLEEYENYTR
ncbi:cyclic nucleotide-binding domain-containing protein [Brachyspira intermedia]|uniref:cyclic nucleotide-binding domain-containing protein n=1 Tax=Brachyspira intermedia TaxID=84377 RepID=UPI003007F090